MKTRTLLALLSLMFVAGAAAEPVYWVSREEGTISRQALDGDVEVLVSGLNGPYGLAVDIDAGHLYWTDPPAVQRSDLDGANVVTLYSDIPGLPDGIALDIDRGKMYWTDRFVDKIFSADMDGSGVQEIVTSGLSSVAAIDVDPVESKIYWAENQLSATGLYRANLDGTSVEQVVVASTFASGVAIDHRLRTIYWAEGVTIYSRPLDGSAGVSTVLTGTDHVQKIDVRGDRIYWTAYDDHVWSANLDGTDITPLVGTLGPQGIAAPVRSVSPFQAVYFTEFDGSRIWRANPDGSRLHEVELTSGAQDVQVELHDAYMVWAANGSLRYKDLPFGRETIVISGLPTLVPFFFANWTVGAPPTIYYANMSTNSIDTVTLDGQMGGPLISSTGQVSAIDLGYNGIYWSTASGEIYAATIDGQSVTPIVTGYGLIQDIAFDRLEDKLYWSQFDGAIHRCDVDGSNVEFLWMVDGWARAIDVRGPYLYWTNGSSSYEGVYRSRTDLFSPELVLAPPGELWGISTPWRSPLDDQAIYWTDYGTDRIMRSNFDGSATTIIADAGLDFPSDVQVDLLGGYVYWTDFGTNKIQRTTIDGGGVIEDLVTTGLVNPDGIDLDLVAKKIYWSDRGTGKIQRSNLDGTGVEDVMTSGLYSHSGLALHVGVGVMFWVEQGGPQDGIYRATLGGALPVPVVSDAVNPNDLALDLVNDHIYWTEAGKVRRADLWGTNRVDIVTGLGTPRGIGVDVVHEYIYWTDSATDLVQRAKFDGSCLETIMYGETPYGLSIPDQNAVVSVGESVTPIARNVLAAPNPFHVTTNIRFEAATTGVAELNIFDVSGRRLRSLVTEPLRGGTQAITWDGRDARGRAVPSGVYFYRLEMGDAVEVGRVSRVE